MSANLGEWLKGISFSLFGAIFFYLFWTNIFSNLINWVGIDLISGVASNSTILLKTFAWVSFVGLYITTVPLYFIYTIIAGARSEVKTKPLELLKAIGVWIVSVPLVLFIYTLINSLVTALNSASILDASLQTSATTYSWVIGLVVILIGSALPFYFVIKGYGHLGDKKTTTVTDIT